MTTLRDTGPYVVVADAPGGQALAAGGVFLLSAFAFLPPRARGQQCYDAAPGENP
jgi:hypothetical protein